MVSRNIAKSRITGPAVFICALILLSVAASGGGTELIQVHNDFSTDPGWEGINNRVEAQNPPTRRQDFGWSPTNHGGGSGGEIGGTVWKSRTPAHHGMKIGPLSFNDPFSASGKLVIMPPKTLDGGAYFGFYNSARQEWRPWSSMAVRIGDMQANPDGSITSDSHVDYMSAGWKAGGFSTLQLPADGKPHDWSLSYEPDATITDDWPHPKLKQWLGSERVPEEELLKRARQQEPTMTLEQLRSILREAEHRGQIQFHTRRGTGWQVRPDPEQWKGRVVFRFDQDKQFSHFIHRSIRDEDLVIDRFGIFNFQLPGGPVEFYLSELTVNGRSIDLSTDPGWIGVGNRTEFVETDFHAKHNYGYSPTNYAGKAPGEIGGLFWRTEPIDPLHGYYADDIGHLTLDDPISFSGNIAFISGGTDAGMVFGYFNSRDKMAEISPDKGGQAGAPLPNAMHLAIEGPTRIGYYFSAQAWPADTRLASHSDGPIFVPDGARHAFTFNYDPDANDGQGTITFTLDGKEWKHNLTKEQRQSGATFDKFGMVNIRRGGKYVEVYLDDLTYTARRNKDAQPTRHQDRIVRVPYPKGGRKH